MIDLHCHILPGIDDGAADLDVSLEMARMAVADGIVTVACTPHVLPGVYENSGADIRARVRGLSAALENAGIPLLVTSGADAHLDPYLPDGLRSGDIPTLGGTRFFLLEPPHHVAPPRLEAFTFGILTAGFVPVLTHPERLSWVDDHYPLIQRLAEGGVLMQLTADSVTGRFGRRPQYWAERILDEGMADLLASDAHDTRERPPRLGEARDAVGKRCGEATAIRLVETNPLAILRNVLPMKLRQSGGSSGPDISP